MQEYWVYLESREGNKHYQETILAKDQAAANYIAQNLASRLHLKLVGLVAALAVE
jgi:hypothetical protein